MPVEVSDELFHFSKERIFAGEECADFFQQFFSAFLQAEKNIGEPTEIYLCVANINICLRFAGKNMVPLYVRALRHLQTETISNPDFTICIWDTKTANQNLPLYLSQFNQYVNSNPDTELRMMRGDIPALTNEIIRTALIGETELTMINAERKLCIHWVSDAAEIPYHDRGAPLRVALNFIFGGNSFRQLLHGGAVGTPHGGVFLGGIGGSGKSTAALNCASASDLLYAGDDYVLVALANDAKAFSVYNSVKVKTMWDLERFPRFRQWIDNEDGVRFDEEKPLVFLNEHIPNKMIREIPLKAIVFPRFATGQEIHYQPMSQQRAFREIATSTIRQTPNDDQPAASMIGKFIKKLPCYELFFGEAQENLPKFITEIINLHS